MAKKPKIDAMFQSLFPPLSKDELGGLRESLVAEGCREPLYVWEETNILLDGHNRFELCEAEGIEYEIVYKQFPNTESAMSWVILNQLARRNMDPKNRVYLIGQMMMLRKQGLGGQKPGTGDGSTARKIADETGSSESTVHRGAKFAEAIDAHSGGDAKKREELLSNDMSRKEIISTAPKLCDRCKRIGALRDCIDCQLGLNEARVLRPYALAI